MPRHPYVPAVSIGIVRCCRMAKVEIKLLGSHQSGIWRPHLQILVDVQPVVAVWVADGPWREALAYDLPKTAVNAGGIVEGDRRRIWRPRLALASDFELLKCFAARSSSSNSFESRKAWIVVARRRWHLNCFLNERVSRRDSSRCSARSSWNRLEIRMSNGEKRTCAHVPCRCVVAAGQTYCGKFCEEAGSEDVEIACQCDHPPACPLTAMEPMVA